MMGTEAVAVSAQIESELAELPPEEARDYLAHLGVAEAGVGAYPPLFVGRLVQALEVPGT